MGKRISVFRVVAFRLISLVAIVVCMAILVDYFRSTPAFCGFRAGCEEVIRSAYGRPLGVPLPVVGLLAFTVFFFLTLIPASRPGRLLGPLAILAGLIGLGLVAVQVFLLHQTCPLCLAVDAAAMLLAAVEPGLSQPTKISEEEEPPTPLKPNVWAWIGLAVVVMAVPLVWSLAEPAPEVPTQVQSHWMADTINVVEITNFTCPYCRQTHPVLEAFLDEQGGRVHFVRLVVPLEYHDNDRSAARAYLAAEQQGRGEPMADALFATDDRSPEALHKLAEQIGLDLEQFDADMVNPALDKQIDHTTRWVEAADHAGLPQIWIQNILLVGVQTPKSLQAALGRVDLARDGR
ncbi:MAG: vitamin K epoxide reductase family protein [Planctomycetota bacterium]